jgi:HlyD family secretion protein
VQNLDKILKKSKWRIQHLIAYVAGASLVAYGIYILFSAEFSLPTVDRDKVRIGEVKRGLLSVNITGNGVIVAKNPEWVVSTVSGQAIKLNVKAGDRINSGQALLELINDELTTSLARSQSTFSATRADIAAKKLDLFSQRVALESALNVAELNYKKVMSLNEIHEKLIKLPNPPVSELEIVQTKLEADLQEGIMTAARKQLSNFEESQKAQLEALVFRESAEREEYAQLKRKVSELAIVSKRPGIVQEFATKVGQSVNAGELIAKIVDPEDVYVTLSIPAIEAHKVAVDQKVKVEVNRTYVNGKIQRIDPNVSGTTVEVDVILEGVLKDAIVGMFVNGTILINEVSDTLYVDIPPGAAENGTTPVFVLSNDEQYASLVHVSMGARSSSFVQILDGLKAGDKILLTEPQGAVKSDKLRLK